MARKKTAPTLTLSEWMAELGRRGGRSRSPRKLEAARAAMERINAARKAQAPAAGGKGGGA